MSRKLGSTIVIITTLLMVSSCVPLQDVQEDGREYVWPLPPAKPKIKYIGSIWGEEDVRKSSPVEILVGKEASSDLFKPYGVTTDRTGRIYVTDTVRRAVFVFDEAMHSLSYLGTGDKGFRVPAGVVVDNLGHVFVSDTGFDAVFLFDANGKLVRKFGAGLLNNPSGMAIDDVKGRLYVVSTKSHRIEVFDLQGKHLFGFGVRGTGNGQFNYPLDIAIDAFGDLYVVDSSNFRVQVFNSEGVYVRDFGSLGNNPGQFSRPKGIAVDTEGNVYVTDAAFNNFQIFDRLGNLLLFVGSGGTSGPGEFSLPADIYIDQNDRIYIADQLNRRIQIFQKLP